MTTLSPEQLVRRHAAQLALPKVVCRLNEMVSDPRHGTGDIVQRIGRDPDLSARLLQVVNSPLYGLHAPVTSAERAGRLLGARQLRDLVVGISVVRRFDSLAPELIDLDAFWRHALAAAMLAQSLADHLGVVHRERYMLIGLLHDIGQLVLCLLLPTQALRIREHLAGQPEAELDTLERSIIGFDHAALGMAVMRQWGLPEAIVQAVHYHHRPEEAPAYTQEAAIGYLASALADAEPPRIDPAMAALLGTSPEHLAQVRETVDRAMFDAVELVYSEIAA